MRFKVDENVPQSVAKLLKNAGHEVQTVLDEGLGGRDDADVLTASAHDNRAFITLDKDFADIRAYAPEHFSGIVVLRLGDQRAATISAAMARLMPLLEIENIAGSLWVVDERRGEDMAKDSRYAPDDGPLSKKQCQSIAAQVRRKRGKAQATQTLFDEREKRPRARTASVRTASRSR